MKKLKHKFLYMKGTKKRIGDIKSIFQNIEFTQNILHSSLISTNNCVTFLYPWGHIIIYTYPQDKIITVDFLYPPHNYKIEKIITAGLAIFQPENHSIEELNIC
jgi:hypothetical protein